jgi:large subunit ribosomal protein L18e
MGIDLIAGGRRIGHNVRTEPVSQNVYLRLLVKLYRLVFQIFLVIIFIDMQK